MSFTVRIITPERALGERQADLVVMPGHDGEVGIMSRHAPYVTLLGSGRLRITSRNEADAVYAIQGGVAQVEGGVLRILAESVAHTAEIDEAALVERLRQLDAAEYEDAIALAEAQAEAQWLVAQLRSAGKQVPELRQL